MAKYRVRVPEVHYVIIDIADAANESDAVEQAISILAHNAYPDGTPLPPGTYDYALEQDEWKVWEA